MNNDYEYVPKNSFTRWLDTRLPILRFTNEHILQFPTPKNLNYFWTFGFILTFFLITQIITGVILAMHYAPNSLLAFDSIEHIMRDVNYGWLIRYAHSNGSSMFFLAVYIHMFRGLYYGSYKEPREVLWILGCIIYFLMIVTAFMGYVLPWGQMSYWAATVIINLVGTLPIIGDSLTQLLLGGFAVDNPTLNRFFSLHYLIPFIIFGLVFLHIWALHVPGNNNPTGVSIQGKQDTVAFHPYYTVKDFFAYIVFLLLFCYFIFYNPNALGHPDNYIEADPMLTPAHIVPEWYLLPFYAILRAVPDKLFGVLLMFGSIVVLFFLPWLDTMKVRSARYRPFYKMFFFIFVLDCLLLGYLGAQVPEGIYLLLSRVSTFYYFAFFILIMPALSRLEKPNPMPIGISNPAIDQNARLD
ncbi:MAG: cytochrome b [Rhodobiaceae bacterium]|jgi:ubiquinol-cytochrome c reductase cytochrome b subunit|nr:cytochrome b [Rhodobiaceae bacterium]|tara:strand:- start:2526 stop:3761 length:1236 start_codon:yes stop_codon:yes gene_type:complete